MIVGTGCGTGFRAAVALALALSLPAAAQTLPQPQHPEPVERTLDRLYQRDRAVVTPDPLARERRALQRIYEDPARRAGLPPQPNLDVPPDQRTVPPALAPTLPPELSRMDRNNDGAISRDEYLRSRSRLLPGNPVRPADVARQRQYLERMDSRFRGADANRDGRVTPEELEGYGSLRF